MNNDSVSISTLPSSLTMGTIMGDGEVKKILMEKTVIPKSCFSNNDPEAVFLFAWCSNPEALKAKFADPSVEIDINNIDDVKAVASMHKQKIDVDKFEVNFLDLIKDIKIDTTKVSSCIAFCD